MRDPIVTHCGHMFDRSSITAWLSQQSHMFCPICHKELTLQLIFPCFPVKSDIRWYMLCDIFVITLTSVHIEEWLTKHSKVLPTSLESSSVLLTTSLAAPFSIPPLFMGNHQIMFILQNSFTPPIPDVVHMQYQSHKGKFDEKVAVLSPAAEVLSVNVIISFFFLNNVSHNIKTSTRP